MAKIRLILFLVLLATSGSALLLYLFFGGTSFSLESAGAGATWLLVLDLCLFTAIWEESVYRGWFTLHRFPINSRRLYFYGAIAICSLFLSFDSWQSNLFYENLETAPSVIKPYNLYRGFVNKDFYLMLIMPLLPEDYFGIKLRITQYLSIIFSLISFAPVVYLLYRFRVSRLFHRHWFRYGMYGLSSLLFILVHLDLPRILYEQNISIEDIERLVSIILTTLFWVYLRLRYNLKAAILSHMIWNTTVFCLNVWNITFSSPGLQLSIAVFLYTSLTIELYLLWQTLTRHHTPNRSQTLTLTDSVSTGTL